MSPSWKGGVINTQEQYERVLALEVELKKLKDDIIKLKEDVEKLKEK